MWFVVCTVVFDSCLKSVNLFMLTHDCGVSVLLNSLYLDNDRIRRAFILIAETARKPTTSGVRGSAYDPYNNPPTTTGPTPQ